MESAAGASSAPIRARLLGPVQITVGDRPVSDDAWSRRSARALLRLLLATPGHCLARDQVLDLLWPDAAPQTSLNALYVALHTLRRALEPDLRTGRASAYVEVAGDVIRLRAEAVGWVDVDAFEAELRRAVGPDRRERLAAALALYAGDLLTDEPYVDWPVARREQLRSAWRGAVLSYAELERETGRPLLAVPALERVLESDPTDEPVYRALMQALAVAGRREDALRQYSRCVDALRDELGVEPDAATRALAAAIRDAPVAPPAPTTAGRMEILPTPANPLVGRERELEALEDLLLDPGVRLVTVTGPGGIGKTRLALEAARQTADEFADGVCFVALAAIRDPILVVPTVARTLGVEEAADRPPAEALAEALSGRELLLVLDNLEQVPDAACDIGELLAACPRLTVLATSREPLRLRAEHLFATPPLAVPPVGQHGALGRLGASGVDRYAAVTLFAERARAVRPGFAISDANAPAVAALCARLEGLPLAIELAAARSRHLAPAELLVRLEHRLAVLTGGPRDLPERLRTMRDAIAWSHDLLDEAEQSLFRRLAVFAGGFTLEAAEAVCLAAGDLDLDVAEGVWALADKSLLRWDGEARFGMLEAVREFGLEHLAASGEEEAVRRAHAAHFVALAASLRPKIEGAEGPAALARLEAEHPNLRVALGEAVERGDAELALRFIAALWKFWWVRRYLSDGRAWAERALALAGGVPLVLQAEARYAAGSLAMGQGDYVAAQSHGEAGLALAAQIDDPLWTAMPLFLLGRAAHFRGEYGQARPRYEAALPIYRDLGRTRLSFGWHGTAMVLASLGAVAYGEGDVDEAAAHNAEALAIWRERGDRWGQGIALINLGAVAAARGDLGQAAARYRESITRNQATGDRAGIGEGLVGLALVAALTGLPERAARLFGAAEALREVAGTPSAAMIPGDRRRALVAAKNALGEEAFAAAWAAGRALTPTEAVAEALALAAPNGPNAGHEEPADPLGSTDSARA